MSKKKSRFAENVTVIKKEPYKKNVKALNEEQEALAHAIDTKDVVLAIGPAGTGKSYLSVVKAIDELEKRNFKRIIITRPAVEAGEQIGFLPGTADEKLDPYLKPIYDIFFERIGGDRLKNYRANGIIEIAPIGFMRGRSIKDSFIIVDEAQNCTLNQLKMILTRIGVGSKMIVNGDPNQSDLGSESGLSTLVSILNDSSPSIETVHLTRIVRSRIVGEILDAFKKMNK